MISISSKHSEEHVKTFRRWPELALLLHIVSIFAAIDAYEKSIFLTNGVKAEENGKTF